ncbi:MAG TPA: HAD family hydrolase [Microvirga sp.]|jgi:phosphoglycolate phosphatase|nr:HAD family hydrolase [Microvirga sp.]
MSPFPAPTVVFDLDGTLADTAADLIATLNVVLAREGLAPLPEARARPLAGAGAKALIECGFAASGRDLTPDRLEELYRFFLAWYADHICIETRLYPGVKRALLRLDEAGFRLAVCTNKFEDHAVAVLRQLRVAHRFAAICGRDTFRYIKPDPRHVTLTVERAGGRPETAVMVGDSRTDIVAAQAAGIPVIAVSFGYTDVPVMELGPDRVIGHFDELADAVESFLRRAQAA